MQAWFFEIHSRPFIITVLAFVLVTALVYWNITSQFDESIILYFQSLAGNPGLDLLMESITEIGDIYYMLIFSIILLIIKKTRKIGLTLMILLVLSTLLTGYIKCGVDRDRPSIDFQGNPFLIQISEDTFALFCEGSYNASYPSGHATRATIFGIILGFSLSHRFPRGCYLLLLYPLLMSISRIYVLQHFPMDVIGGAILGIMLAGVIGKKTKLAKMFESPKT